MTLEFNFYKQVSNVSIEYVFDGFLDEFKKKYTNINVISNNISIKENKIRFPELPPVCGIIRCVDNNNCIVISYWDRCFEFCYKNFISDFNLIEIITSSGLHSQVQTTCQNVKITPFSYTCYHSDFENVAERIRTSFDKKKDKELFFRGLPYHMRKWLMDINPAMISHEKLNYIEYCEELNQNRISLSLDGAGLICHRDMEILSTGSVLFRPKMDYEFHNPLVPFVHYIPFERADDPNLQLKIINDTFNMYRYDNDLLNYVSENGLKWFLNNGTTAKNINILMELITPNSFK